MNEKREFVELKVPAKPEYVGVVRLLVSGLANRMGFSYDEIEDMKVAVAEACTNAVNHAYKNHLDGLMIIGCGLFEDRIEIMIIDHGQSFDYEAIRGRLGPVDHNTPLHELNEGGMGIFLMKSLMDSVEINSDNGVIVVMTKYLNRDGVENDDTVIPETTQPQ